MFSLCKTTHIFFSSAVSVTMLFCAPTQAASEWPSKPITIVVSYPPGGGADLMARLVAQKMSSQLKQSVIVENKPGASAQIGASYVANSAPDGYTLLVDAASFSINPNLYPKLPYDGIKAFAPIGVLARFPSVIVVTPSFPAQSLADLIGLAKAEPGGVFYASAGNGSAQNLGTVLFMEKAGIKLEQIPYKGGGPAMTDVMGGQVPMYFANVASSIAHIKAGKLRALAVTGSTRAEALPDVPTLKEAGVVDAESYEWNGMFAPKGTPPEIVDKLALALEQALDSPSVSDRIKELGGQRLPGGREAAVKFVQEQSDRAGEIIRHNNIKVD